jgi:predicted GIY-YIG superfamily endonuclease
MQKLFISKHKNGYYYIYYNDDNGKRQSITTKTKIKSEALKREKWFKTRIGRELLLS